QAAAPSCRDGIKNGNETDVDCGGSCSKCSIGKRCATNSDCASNNCNPSSHTCQQAQATAPSCSDGIKNGNETDVDCGGSCSKCSSGKRCLANSDCATNNCNPSSHTCR